MAWPTMPRESNLDEACSEWSWLGLRVAWVDGAHFETPNTVKDLAKPSLVGIIALIKVRRIQ